MTEKTPREIAEEIFVQNIFSAIDPNQNRLWFGDMETKIKDAIEKALREERDEAAKERQREYKWEWEMACERVRIGQEKIKALEAEKLALIKAEAQWAENYKALEERENNYLETIGQDTRTIKELRLKVGLLEAENARLREALRELYRQEYPGDMKFFEGDFQKYLARALSPSVEGPEKRAKEAKEDKS